MKKCDIIKIDFFGRIVEACILQITDKWVKVVFDGNTYKTSIEKIQR